MNKKITLRALYSVVFLFVFLINPAYPGPALVINASDSTGEWSKGVVTGRQVIFSGKPSIKSEIQVYVEKGGKYQLFSYIHHNWRKAIPRIYVEVSNDGGVLYEGYHKIENIWYLDRSNPGRWFMVSLTKDPYWELPEGKFTIRFWVDGGKDIWNNDNAAMEDLISIDKFFLVPVQESGGNLYLPWLIYPEAGKGNWDILEYHPRYATNLVESSQNAQTLTIPVNVPYSDYFRLWVSLFSPLDNELEMVIQSKADKQKTSIKIKGRDIWSFVSSDLMHLNQGEYVIILKHTIADKILIDYLMFLPD